MAVAAFSLTVLMVAYAQEWGVGAGENLVKNPGFEEVQDGKPVSWSAPAPVYSSDDGTARTGEHSLKFVNDDPNSYVLCGQQIDLQPGRVYEVKAWVKTEGVEGADSGATVCVEWSGPEGKYLGGSYPGGKKGDTTEWTEVGGTTHRVPKEAASCSVTCYVRKGMSGTAWWDDVSVRRMWERPMHSVLLRPSYRGWIRDDGPDEAEVRVNFSLADLDQGAETVRVAARLTPDGEEKLLAERTADEVTGDQLRLRLALPELAVGSYRLEVDLVEKATGKVLCQDVHRLERRTGAMPRCFVDQHNRVILDGEPFFPLGMYWSGVNEEQLQVYADSAFNCLMPYGRPNEEQMDLIDSFGLKVIYSIKDFYFGTGYCPEFIKSEADEEPAVRERVRKYRDHPALLAWYLNDERPLSMLSRLEAHQRWVEEEDPNHPTWVVLYQVRDVGDYLRTFDVIGTDPYPIPQRPPAMAGEWTRLTRSAVEDERALWQVPQVFAKADRSDPERPKRARAPTFEEMRSMTWQCITEGADGLVFYAWFELRRPEGVPFEERWPQVKRVAEEVNAYVPALLSIEPTPEVEVEAPEAVHWTLRSHEGKVYLFMVNDAEEAAAATVRFPKQPHTVTLGGEAVTVGDDGTFEAALDPLGVNIYEVQM